MMADFLKTMETVWRVEHGNDKRKILHFNNKEKSYTFYGIYPYTKLKSYKKIDDTLKKHNWNTKKASKELSKDKALYQEVLGFYYLNFWKPMNLDYIESTEKTKEIMVFVINAGIGRKKTVVRAIQKIIGAKVDGIMGHKTIRALNNFDNKLFDKLFDKFEVDFYERLVRLHHRLKWALHGWINRAYAV